MNDFKHVIVKALESSYDNAHRRPLRLVICTPFGIVNGTPPSPDAAFSPMARLIEDARDAVKANPRAFVGGDGRAVPEDCLVLEDVEVAITGGLRVKMAEIAIFYKDICGFSIGTI